MKQQRLIDYRPNYPRKVLRGAVLTAAALVAMGGAAGCRNATLSGEVLIPEPTAEELVLDGEVAIPEPTEEPMIRTDGMVAILEPTEDPSLLGKIVVPEPTEEPLILDGEVAIPEPTEEELRLPGEPYIEEPEPTPEVPLRTTGVLLMPSATPEA